MNSRIKRMLASSILTLALTANVVGSVVPGGLTAFAGEQLGQTDFEDGIGLPWHVCESVPAEMEFEIENGVYSITIVNPGGASKGGEDRWDCQFRHRGLTIVSGCTYNVTYTITASNSCSYYTKIGDMGEPFAEDWHGEPDGSQHESYWDVKQLQANQTTTVTGTFTANRTAEVEWAFHLGGDSVPAGTVFTFDNMSLNCTNSSEYDYTAAESWVRSDILTNQLGYFETFTKKATLLSSDTNSIAFYLKDSSGETVYTGESVYKGADADSGDTVHELDFSSYTEAGTYYLETEDGAKSREFEIGDGALYSYMLYDSLNYFYQNRSGIAIESDYIISGDASTLARAAGHSSDIATIEQTWGYSGSSGTQDVTGGWYDAGDHGKYVVNGGISLWTMQNQYERALVNGDASVYDDGTMSIPENSNGYPDLLDEARYEMEWFLKMIVQTGDYAGMAYHKVHDIKWTALALSPVDDTEERIIKPPTTAATLNLAACGAQAYRLWKDIDADFAQTCLDAAIAAYAAAEKHPSMYAPLDESVGGGPYGDTDATDEFYWAAAELYLATGEKSYLDDAKKSTHYLEVTHALGGGEHVDTIGTMDWGNTAALGSFSLALYTDELDDSAVLIDNIKETADYYIGLETEQGYGQPYGQSTLSVTDSSAGYIWGSNSVIMNNAIALAYAYELSEDTQYLSAVVGAMDYILGRNPMDYSYVTGYGSHAVQYPHHRWWSNQVDESFPSAPNGVLVGGPNSGMQDPWVKGAGWKQGEIEPAKCYLDHIEAWSVNECTINWNTPLAWVSAFISEEAGGIVVTSGSASGDANSGETIESNDAAGAADGTDSNAGDKDDSTGSTTKADKKEADEASDDKSSDGKSNLWIIILAVLAGLVSIELFVLKLVKTLKGGNAQATTPVQTTVVTPDEKTAVPTTTQSEQEPKK